MEETHKTGVVGAVVVDKTFPASSCSSLIRRKTLANRSHKSVIESANYPVYTDIHYCGSESQRGISPFPEIDLTISALGCSMVTRPTCYKISSS